MDIRPSNHLTNLVGQIERAAGNWDFLMREVDERRSIEALTKGASAITALDDTMPTSPRSLELLIAAHYPETMRSEREIVALHAALLGQEIPSGSCATAFRKSHLVFSASNSTKKELVQVFPTVAPFLVRQRLLELLHWFEQTKQSEAVHPLLLIGTMHLCLLHISPFQEGSHSTALVLLWKNLITMHYPFCRYAHPAAIFQEDPQSYFQALRQAEKTAYGNWSTLNIWLEYFLSMMLVIQHRLGKQYERRATFGRLTPLQRQIVDTIDKRGSLSRDDLAQQLGINENTVKYNLTVLTKRGYLTRLGGGRTTSYRLSRVDL